MRKHLPLLLATLVAGAQAFAAQPSSGGVALKTTFVALGQQANAVLVEPVTLNDQSRIALLITHPERINKHNDISNAS